MDYRTPLGRHRVASVRDDDKAIDLSASVTEMSAESVRKLFQSVNGRSLVRTALKEQWPWTASSLGTKSTAAARDAGLHDEIRWVTGGSKHLVTRRLNSGSGKRLLKNLFWDLWPEEDVQPPKLPPDDEAADDAVEVAATAVDDKAAPAEKHDTDPPPQGFQPGSFVSSRYDIKQEIGRGGFGVTWLARDRLTDLDLVIKVPHEDDGGAIRHELDLAFQIVHPNICQAFPDRDDETGHPFLVMQHGGVDLRALLERQGWEPLPLALALHVLTSAADALDYLHSRLVLHLDVSPMNILIDDEDVVRLTDFGASSRARRAATLSGSETMLAQQVTSFNGAYAAPELLKGEGRSRSDQYSLFLVFATLLTGRMPQHAGDLPKPPFPLLSDVQNAAVARALKTDPEARFETCGEAARAVADGIGRVPQRVLARDLESYALDLRGRLRREEKRPFATHTTRVGGVIKLGGRLERLLLATYLWVAGQEGFDAAAEVRSEFPSSSLFRATGNMLVRLLQRHASSASAKRPEVGAFIADLVASDSRLRRLIYVRNQVAHNGVAEGIEAAADGVAMLLDEYLGGLPAK